MYCKSFVSKTPTLTPKNRKNMGYLQQLKQWLIKWFLTIYALLWKLKLRYGKVSKIKDKILFPLNKPVNPIFPTLTESAGSEILNRMKLTLGGLHVF